MSRRDRDPGIGSLLPGARRDGSRAAGARRESNGLLSLQARAGNRAVAGLLKRRIVQRSTKAGWSDADTAGPVGGWNAAAHEVGTIRRVPVEGLTLGNQQDFVGDEKNKTVESAAGRAIVLLPPGLDPDQPVDVFLHLHGFTHRAGDPHAGWRQDQHDGSVRDVDQDRIEAQLQAAGTTQIVGILPQGVAGSDFGDFPVHRYVEEVLGKLVAVHELPKQPASGALRAGRLVLSAHSGGGDRVARMISGSLGAQVSEVVLFEAIHSGGLKIYTKWALGHLNGVLAAAPAHRVAAISACPVLRAYYSVGGDYQKRYQKLAAALDDWFTAHQAALGADHDALRAKFRVIGLDGTSHETVVRGLGDDAAAGPIADALRALDRPGNASRVATSGKATWSRGRARHHGRAAPVVVPPAGGPVAPTTTPAPKAAATAQSAHLVAMARTAGLAAGPLAAMFGIDPYAALASVLVSSGMRDPVEITDVVFTAKHLELNGGRIPAGRDDLVAEWRNLRRRYVTPALRDPDRHTTAAPAGPVAGPAPAAAGPVTVPAPAAAKPATAPVPAKVAGVPKAVKPMTEEERKKAVEAAVKQVTTAGKKADRDAIAAALEAAGTTAEDWFADIVPDATFLGRRISASGGVVAGVHQELYGRLQTAEQTLLAKYEGRSAAEVGALLGLHTISGIRPPKKATGGKLPSYHCFGLAVDINKSANPFVGNKTHRLDPKKKDDPEEVAKHQEYMENRSPRIVERAMLLLHHETFDVEKPIKLPKGSKDKAGDLWEVHHRASDTLAEYLRLADDLDGQRLATLVTALNSAGDARTLDWWKQRIATDRQVISHWDFENHPAPEQGGYLDLSKDLVEALVGAGLLWGGQYNTGKDMMHFDWRGGTVKTRHSE